MLFIEFFVEWKANRIFTLFAFSEPLRQRLYVRRGRWSARTFSITNPDQFPDSGIQSVAQQAWVSESYRISLESHWTLIGVSEESHLGFIEVSSKFLQWRIFTKGSSLKNLQCLRVPIGVSNNVSHHVHRTFTPKFNEYFANFIKLKKSHQMFWNSKLVVSSNLVSSDLTYVVSAWNFKESWIRNILWESVFGSCSFSLKLDLVEVEFSRIKLNDT